MVDVFCLLHRCQLHVSALMAIFRLNELTKKKHRHLYLACVLYTVDRVFYLMGYEFSCVLSREGGVCGFCCANLSIE